MARLEAWEMSKTVDELIGCLQFAEFVRRILPVNDEMDRLAGEAMRRHAETVVRRKITKKVRP
jgi:hypothetical protein